ncbi:MAG TPA: RNA-binding protein [Porticoccaceae bacterium]|jgi:ribosome-associated heat shock protein Hsp15|nr:RNA-binding protein [Porticoccaceae bacterium]
MDRVRIDKWLWAARFFRSRALAKEAVAGGKVHVNGLRVKPSKEIMQGENIEIRRGWEQLEVEVTGVSDQRRSAPLAATLYRETSASIEARARRAEARKQQAVTHSPPARKPTKKQRRQIHRFRQLDDL